MSLDAWRPLGEAMRAYQSGDADATLLIESDDGAERAVPMSAFFRDADELPELEAYALSLCRSPVLDIGAGTGPHALRLEAAGHRVTAIDVLPEAVTVMRERGVHGAALGDVTTFEAEGGVRFHTVLLLMNGIGVVGDVDGLVAFLRRAKTLLTENGQLLLDSTDLRCVDDPVTRAGIARREAAGMDAGRVTYRLRFGERLGAPYSWLYIDPDRLRDVALAERWAVQVLFEDEEGQYLARLRPLGSAQSV